ncbi:MAG: peptide chain release factor 1 [Holosporales bacterium]|jgi:peptide chain release factor 1|nr:peptide chain release factor 1 [Holosporales bacterium]
MSFQKRLDQVLSRHGEISAALENALELPQSEVARLSKELSHLSKLTEEITALRKAEAEFASLNDMLGEPMDDADFKGMIYDEIERLNNYVNEQNYNIRVMLLPKDGNDERNVIMEIRAGTGGDEAGLFAADLLRMYQRYAANKGWSVELLSSNDTGAGSLREAVVSISGIDVFAHLKFESGVHRVQRVPETEASGRIHTSAATVAVLPEAEDVDIVIDEKDLQIDVFRASGAGGQHVNKTESAIRITHIPTGLVVSQQDDRSQHKNKAKAMKILRAKLYEQENDRQHAERAAERKSQVGRGDRSERIRTYNFPQGRVTDHRINLTLYKLAQILEGESLDELIEALITENQARLLATDSD